MSIRNKLRPEDFRTDCDYMSTFNNRETEVSARVLVQYLQQRGELWEPVNQKNLDAWNKRRCPSDDNFCFNKLIGHGEYSPLLLNDGTVTIQDAFIASIASNHKLFK